MTKIRSKVQAVDAESFLSICDTQSISMKIYRHHLSLKLKKSALQVEVIFLKAWESLVLDHLRIKQIARRKLEVGLEKGRKRKKKRNRRS